MSNLKEKFVNELIDVVLKSYEIGYRQHSGIIKVLADTNSSSKIVDYIRKLNGQFESPSLGDLVDLKNSKLKKLEDKIKVLEEKFNPLTEEELKKFREIEKRLNFELKKWRNFDVRNLLIKNLLSKPCFKNLFKNKPQKAAA